MDPDELKALIEESLDGDKAENIVTIPLHGRSSIADYMIIASGTSSRHVSAMASKLRDRLAFRGVREVKIEGLSQCDWVAIDTGDIIVHLFRPEVRAFYNIEKMWGAYQSFGVVDSHSHVTA